MRSRATVSFLLRGTMAALLLMAAALLPSPAAPSAEAAFPGEVKKLTASDAEQNDSFGSGVAVSGDIAVVGAFDENAGGPNAGAAYVFRRDEGGAGNWGEVKKLVASDAERDDAFGRSVAVSGDTAVVGAYEEDTGGTNAGAAYVFQRELGGADNWGQVKKLTASDAHGLAFLGDSVAINGDTAVVGALFEDSGGNNAGAAYVFQRNQGGAENWGEVKKLTASDAHPLAGFGGSVAVSGDIAVVGAASKVSGGAAYVFARDQGGASNWGEVRKLTASDAQVSDFFGVSVAVSGDVVVVGALGEDSFGAKAGAAYVYVRDEGGPGNWGEVRKLPTSDLQAFDRFGSSVAVSGDTTFVGASTAGANTGAAYVFQRNEGGPDNWGEVKKLLASDIEPGDLFGDSVAVSGGTFLAGAQGEDAEGKHAGAAYVFEEPTPPTPVGGVALDPDLSALPVATTDEGGHAGLLASAVAAAAAGVVALGGAAWYAKRRKVR